MMNIPNLCNKLKKHYKNEISMTLKDGSKLFARISGVTSAKPGTIYLSNGMRDYTSTQGFYGRVDPETGEIGFKKGLGEDKKELIVHKLEQVENKIINEQKFKKKKKEKVVQANLNVNFYKMFLRIKQHYQDTGVLAIAGNVTDAAVIRHLIVQGYERFKETKARSINISQQEKDYE